MKVYKAFAFLSIFIILFYNCSLPANDEEKGDSEGEEKTLSHPNFPGKERWTNSPSILKKESI